MFDFNNNYCTLKNVWKIKGLTQFYFALSLPLDLGLMYKRLTTKWYLVAKSKIEIYSLKVEKCLIAVFDKFASRVLLGFKSIYLAWKKKLNGIIDN